MARISKGQLEKLHKKYHTDAAIGELFGISRQAVHQLRVRYGISAIGDKYKERNQEIIRLYMAGVPGTKIAIKLKLSKSHTYRIINEHLKNIEENNASG